MPNNPVGDHEHAGRGPRRYGSPGVRGTPARRRTPGAAREGRGSSGFRVEAIGGSSTVDGEDDTVDETGVADDRGVVHPAQQWTCGLERDLLLALQLWTTSAPPARRGPLTPPGTGSARVGSAVLHGTSVERRYTPA